MDDPSFIAAKFSLTDEQRTLFVVLHARSERIARMYLGAIIAMKDCTDPERFTKAAHEIRELMEKISEVANVEIRSLNERMGARVAELEKAFNEMLANSKLKPPDWDGPADGSIRRMLNKLKEFFQWKTDHQPKRRDEVKQVFRALEGHQLPSEDLEKIAIEKWMDIRTFFVNVAHHQFEPVEAQFHENLTYVEQFLSAKLNPKTFADFDAVDAIIEEGEKK
jgi:hypothetical protein